MRRGIGLVAAVLAIGVALWPEAAEAKAKAAEKAPVEIHYGSDSLNFFMLYQGGPALVLLFHENGHNFTSVRPEAALLQGSGFTVMSMEWRQPPEPGGGRIWGALTTQIEQAVEYAVSHAAALGIDPGRIAMVGASGGANAALLTAANMDARSPGRIKAVVSLSGDVNPVAQLERARQAEEHGEKPNVKVVRKFSRTYGCKNGVNNCPMGYLEEWSPYDKILKAPAKSAPAMLLAASLDESSHRIASWEDQVTMAAALEAKGLPAEVLRPQSGHGFAYMSVVRKPLVAFLVEHDVDGGPVEEPPAEEPPFEEPPVEEPPAEEPPVEEAPVG